MKKVKLGDVATFGNGATIPKERGIIPAFGGNGITDYVNSFNTNEETIIIGRVGANCGSIHYYKGKCWVTDNALYLKTNVKTNSKFLSYLLKYANLNKVQIGSSQPLITRGILSKLEISLPSLPTQTAIAKVLSLLDEKIELNNKTNKELENLAKTIYEYYFIQNKKESWNRKKLKDLFTFDKGTETGLAAYFNHKQDENFVKYYRVGDIDGDSKTFVDITKNDLVFVEPYDVVVTFDGSVGKIGICLNGAISSGLRKIYDPSGKFDNSLVWAIFLDKRIQATIRQYATGSILLHASCSIDYLEIPYDEEIFLNFQKNISPIFSQIIKNKQESAELAQLRDFLLPLLMNGQVKVDDTKYQNRKTELKLAARGNIDEQTLRNIYEAIDENDR